LQYDAAGNVASDGSQLSYDAEGQQAQAILAGNWDIRQSYDGDRLRVKKVKHGVTTQYLRSSVFDGAVVAEITSGGQWARG